MGLEYVRQLAGRGYNIVLAALPGRNDENGNPTGPPSPEVICSLMAAKYPGQDFLPIGIDLARTESAQELCDRIKAERPDAFVEVLINNAGILNAKHFRQMTAPQIQRELLLHNFTTTMLCHYLLPAMKERGKGYVLTVSSLAAWTPFPFVTTYSATKNFNRTLVRGLRTEYRGTGVKIATVYFGAVDTPLYKLKPSYRRLARRLRVMISPEDAARRALRMLFAGRSGSMPGVVNHIGRFVFALLPSPFVSRIDRRVSHRMGIDD